MDTVRVDICYRPIRIAWAISSKDKNSLRLAIRYSHALMGGRFNPIILVDRPESKELVELFRCDIIVPVGDGDEVKEFCKQFGHLISPNFADHIFSKATKYDVNRCFALDIHNGLTEWVETREWENIKEVGFRRLVWDNDDPLADVFLIQYGGYPDPSEIGTDYLSLLSEVATVIDTDIELNAPIPMEMAKCSNISYLARHGAERHYSLRSGWDYPGFYVGDGNNVDDLVEYWNIRAADVNVRFLDINQPHRFEDVNSVYEADIKSMISNLSAHRNSIGIWTSERNADAAKKIYPGQKSFITINRHIWNGHNVVPPLMIFGQETSLAVISNGQRPQISFALKDKPFNSNSWFFTQHLVASVFVFGPYERSDCTFRVPYLPEINEFAAREMIHSHDRLRIEPERLGIIIDAADHDLQIRAITISSLIERIFATAGLKATLSGGGLITRQLISRLGGIDNARAFKIPGVRRLLKTYGPSESFTKEAALQLIGGRDPERPTSSFNDHKSLYIEPRPRGEDLTPNSVFEHLVAKGLFRIGAKLTCSTCNLPSWIALDVLRQSNVCELCGTEFDGTRQLVSGKLHYRRTGVLGLEKNSQGAIPVALVLQQLASNLSSTFNENMFTSSWDLHPIDGKVVQKCESDIVAVLGSRHPERPQVLIGECKDSGGRIDRIDIENLKRIAERFPKDRIKAVILIAKLSEFTVEEIELAKSIDIHGERPVILLSDRELEPYFMYERVRKGDGERFYGHSLDEMIRATQELYFSDC